MKPVSGCIFVITGPTGSGKTTLLKNLLEDPGLKKRLVKSISFTTRPKRPDEKDKKDYFFISESKFRQKHREKKILEWTKYLGYYYATPREFIEEQLGKEKNVILCLDLKGAQRLKRLYPDNAITIFVKPPSLKVLRQRIQKRSQTSDRQEIARRMNLARKELAAKDRHDYCLVNKDLELAVKELKEIILSRIQG